MNCYTICFLFVYTHLKKNYRFIEIMVIGYNAKIMGIVPPPFIFLNLSAWLETYKAKSCFFHYPLLCFLPF